MKAFDYYIFIDYSENLIGYSIIKRNNIEGLLPKITSKKKNIELFAEVLEFIKRHDTCIVFISVDDFQYQAFMKLVEIVNDKTHVVKESELKIGSVEYQL